MKRAHMKLREGRVAHVKMAKEILEKFTGKELRTVEHSVLQLLLIHRTTESNEGYWCDTAGSSLILQCPTAANGSAAQRAGTPTTSCAMPVKAVQAKLWLKHKPVLPLQLLI